jgi:hypothetical protein
MAEPQPTASPAHPSPGAIVLTRGEFFWLTLAIWTGGIFILTVMPMLLLPRVGMPLGIVGSYLVFFLAWQPVQIITQRTLGMRVAFVRMVVFVGGAATIAFYVRELLLDLAR